MAVTDNIEWLIRHPQQVKRFVRGLQLLAGLLFLALGCFLGKHQISLVLRGDRTAGVIVDYNLRTWRTEGLTNTSYVPIVEFRAGENAVRFEDWLGYKLPGTLNQNVTVLYDPAQPSKAMIDRRAWNWLPWGPLCLLGAFLLLVGIKNLIWTRE